ncbi:histidine kinase [Candidatus Synechococcus calcipolaris G9]|uniref:Adaptive-response sensory-kinase SasA n=1 Tax=Candidatus Synechococcus calcipolaris G9 TaxID=1497997 RepID=A0ABT6EWC1_9SYNE|nr:histidine kinase [Candidatus Synechococcus calcipolaris]MDG2989418.1 histidine kinase [Candidatus Synechococcus calcipolaris G9]
MEITPQPPLGFLLFVANRPGDEEEAAEIQSHLYTLDSNFDFDLKIVPIGEQPYLLEEYKLVATPALIKIRPEPRQTLTGRKLIHKVDYWWPRWQREVAEILQADVQKTAASQSDCTMELVRVQDESFKLRRQVEVLEAQLLFKDRIIALLAHELRNPLTALGIALETLETNWSAESGVRLDPGMILRLLTHARNQSQTMGDMITDLLLAARGPSASLNICPRQLDMKQLCQETLEQLRDGFAQKQQQLTSDIPLDAPFVYGDGDRIRQVLINLLDNASKYTPEKGSIHLSLLHRMTQKLQITVCDTGPGIPAEQQEQIFRDTVRLDRDRAIEGYGIGLSLCRQIIQAHYGQIWVDSTLGKGSCFHFTLPVYSSTFR